MSDDLLPDGHRYGNLQFRTTVMETWGEHAYDYRTKTCRCGIPMSVEDWEFHVADQVARALEK